MSLEDLLAQDSADVLAVTMTPDASAGKVADSSARLSAIPVRVDGLSATQQSLYADQGMRVTHTAYVQQQVYNGEALRTSDGLYLRVRGVTPIRGIGQVNGYYELLCEQVVP